MGVAKVAGLNPLKETILVELESGATVELPLSKITTEAGHSPDQGKES